MDTTKLTIRLPKENVSFIKAYAKANGMTVTEVIDRFLRRMQAFEKEGLSEEVKRLTGLVPEDVDVKEEYHQHSHQKHRGTD